MDIVLPNGKLFLKINALYGSMDIFTLEQGGKEIGFTGFTAYQVYLELVEFLGSIVCGHCGNVFGSVNNIEYITDALLVCQTCFKQFQELDDEDNWI